VPGKGRRSGVVVHSLVPEPLNKQRMKYIYIAILLFLPTIVLSQSQVLNGIDLNGPKDFKKSGHLTWTKGNDTVFVSSIKGTLSKEEFQSTCRQGSRASEFIETDIIEISGKEYPYCVQYGDNDVLLLQTVVWRGGFTYYIHLSTYTFDYEQSVRIEESGKQVFYMAGYMITRVEQY
jgi:hypothetical protein